MGRPKASETRDTRREILEAALELFSETGFHGTGLRDIARAVGIRESAIYHHFASKDVLLDALLAENATEGRARLENVVAGMKDVDLQTLFETVALNALEKFGTLPERKRFRIILSDGIRLAQQGRIPFWERIGVARGVLVALLQRLMDEKRIRKGDAEVLAHAFMGPLMLWRLMTSVAPEHRFVTDYRAFAKTHVEQFLKGALPAEAARKPAPRKPSTRSARVASKAK